MAQRTGALQFAMLKARAYVMGDIVEMCEQEPRPKALFLTD